MKKWSNEVFARNLIRYMNLAGKNQKEMAEIVGVSAPTFNEWTKAKKLPRIDKIQKLADYFGIVKSDLLEDKVTDDFKEKNDIATDIVIRMSSDKDFKDLVKILYKLDSKQIKDIKNMLSGFIK